MLGDLKNYRLMVLKAVLFLIMGCMAGGMILNNSPDIKTAFLLMISIWAFCRFYYFCFYVVEKYIDPKFKFAGIMSAVLHIAKMNRK